MGHHPFSPTEAGRDAHDFQLLDYATSAAMLTEDFQRASSMDFDTLEQLTIDFLIDISAPPYSIWSIERTCVQFDEEFWRASPYLMLKSPDGRFVVEGVSTSTLKLFRTLYYDRKFPSNSTELLRLGKLTKKFGIQSLITLFTEFLCRIRLLNEGRRIRILDSTSALELEESRFEAPRRNRNRQSKKNTLERSRKNGLGKRKSPTDPIDFGMEDASNEGCVCVVDWDIPSLPVRWRDVRNQSLDCGYGVLSEITNSGASSEIDA